MSRLSSKVCAFLLALAAPLVLTVGLSTPAAAATYPACDHSFFTIYQYGPEVPTSQNGAAKCYMGNGLGYSNAIMTLQRQYNTCYANRSGAPVLGLKKTLDVDGGYGTLTRNAVKFVQTQAGFTGTNVDGWYGPMTANVMYMVDRFTPPYTCRRVPSLLAVYGIPFR